MVTLSYHTFHHMHFYNAEVAVSQTNEHCFVTINIRVGWSEHFVLHPRTLYKLINNNLSSNPWTNDSLIIVVFTCIFMKLDGFLPKRYSNCETFAIGLVSTLVRSASSFTGVFCG